MSRFGRVAMGAVLLLAGSAALAWHWQVLGFRPVWTALSLVAIIGVPSAVWLILGQHDGQPRRLPRIFWLGLFLLLLGLLAAQPWYTVTRFTAPKPIRAGQNGTLPGDSMRRAVLPTHVRTALRGAFPDLVVGAAWTVLDAPQTEYEIWLKKSGQTAFALQVLWQGGTIRIENQQWNSLYTPHNSGELPRKSLVAAYRPGKAVLGPFFFPGYLLYLAPTVGESWVVDRYTAVQVGGGSY